MNAIGIALICCVVQVTLIGLLAGGLYLVIRRLRPAAAAPVVFTSLAIVVALSLFVLSPWPRWTPDVFLRAASVENRSTEGVDVRPVESDTSLLSTNLRSTPGETLDTRAVEFDSCAPPSGDAQTTTPTRDSVSPTRPSPSTAALLWQTILDEIAKSGSSDSWRWPAVVGMLLLAAMTLGLGWLVLGVVAVRRQRLRSRPVLDRELLELADVLRAELACRRPIEVHQSDDLATAATIGWRRPVLLLPADWTTWSADQRRAVLAHEIAHARSRDFLALLFGQLGLALHFYHPLVHWLIGRLRLEQELAADAAAASVSGGQRQYLTAIAELVLHRQDRAVPWPARTFLPTQTTFLRRIAMLRDSELRFDRPSIVTRVMTVGVVLACGLLVAGLRGPSGSILAMAADPKQPTAADDSIDTTYMNEKASMLMVMRPAAVFARGELAAMARLFEQSGDVVPKGTHLSDFRQITVIMPEADIPSGPRQILVLQWAKPVAEKTLRDRMSAMKDTGKEYKGKKIYKSSSGGGTLLVCDDHTAIQAGSEQAMDAYLAGTPGILPKWLPAKAWESFRADQFVIAADTAMMRREIKGLTEQRYSPPIVRAALLPISSLCEDNRWLGLGAKLDGTFAVHAWAEAKDAESSIKVLRTAEALKTLVQIAVKDARTQIDANQRPNLAAARPLFDAADALLDRLKLEQDGNDVRLSTSVDADEARLGTVLSAIDATVNLQRAARDPSTKQGIRNLVEDFFHNNFRDVTSRETIEWGELTKTNDGNFSIRYKYRARIWDRETKIINQVFTFNPKGKFVSVHEGKDETDRIEKAAAVAADGATVVPLPSKKTEQAPKVRRAEIGGGQRKITADQVIVEDLALKVLVAIREKNDAALKTLAVDCIKGWRDALSHFALEARERFTQNTGKTFVMYPVESLVEGDLAVVRCSRPKEIPGDVCLVLYFVKTVDGWRNWMLRNSRPDKPLGDFLKEKPPVHTTTTESKGQTAATADAIIEGVGWKDVRVDMKREDLLKVLGKPDDNSTSDWLKWVDKHIDCTFHTGATGVSEIRFNPGFAGALANGLKLGSPGGKVLKLYGEPEHVTDQGGGGKQYEYSQKGILFWTHQGRVSQIVVFKPYVLHANAGNEQATAASIVPAVPLPPGARTATIEDLDALKRTAEATPQAVSVRVTAEMRTRPQDNFSLIGPTYGFVPIQVWKQFGDKPKWRVEKPERVAAMDGESTVMLVRKQTVVKLPQPAPSAFDNDWLVGLCDSKAILANELRAALTKGWQVSLAEETSAAGEKKVVVVVEAKSGLADTDYMKNKFFGSADLRRVYRFDAKTMRLEGFDAYLHQSGGDVKVFAVKTIAYDEPIDAKVFALEIPKTAHEYKEPQRLPDNEKYEKMTPAEAARAFFEACAKEDWDEAGKFSQPFSDDMKNYLGGLELVSLGKPFKPAMYGGWMVPYTIKFKNGQTKSWNLAIRNDNPGKRYVVDGGL